MNIVADIKRFVLRALGRMEGLPLPEAQLVTAINGGFTPRPLLSDVHLAMRELEADGFVQGVADELDKTAATWTLTEKGNHKARGLG